MYSSNRTKSKQAPWLYNYGKWLEKLEQCLVDLVENEPYCDLNLVVEFKEVKDNPAVLAAAQRTEKLYTYRMHGPYLPTIDKEKAVTLAKGFIALKDLGATFKEHPALYLRMFGKEDDADKLANGFTVLKNLGATFSEHPELYQEMMKNGRYSGFETT